jgi:elongator complex protein 1
MNSLCRFPEFCFAVEPLSPLQTPGSNPSPTEAFVGQSAAGVVFLASQLSSEAAVPLATTANSFAVTPSFIIYTTTSHESFYIPVSMWKELLNKSNTNKVHEGWESRRVERGSRIVVTVPANMSLVLQMPRGNLETINPRPMVLEIIKQDIKRHSYRKAFLACRKHRIDLSILVTYDLEGFLSNLTTFIDQIHEVDFLNLFLTNVGRSTEDSSRINQICDTIRLELEKKALKRYINSILTAHVVKTPPDYEAGLGLLRRLEGLRFNFLRSTTEHRISPRE